MIFLAESLTALIVDLKPTGSKFTCDPPVLTTDEDYVVLTTDMEKFLQEAHNTGWESSESEEYDFADTDFISFRQGEVNLIVTTSPSYYSKWVVATHLAKRFNLLNKLDRKDLFSAILEGHLTGG